MRATSASDAAKTGSQRSKGTRQAPYHGGSEGAKRSRPFVAASAGRSVPVVRALGCAACLQSGVSWIYGPWILRQPVCMGDSMPFQA